MFASGTFRGSRCMISERSDDRRKWVLLGAVGSIGGLIMLDETVVGVALPTIARDLSLPPVAAHWVVNAYMLAFAAFAAAGGKLGDILGHRHLIIAGLLGFGAASLAAGLAQDGTVLIVARVLQGLCAAVIFPGTVAMIMIAFPPEQRGLAMGTLAAIGTSFLALGPLVGGFFTEVISWRWVFWINVPVVAAVAVILWRLWRDPPRPAERPAYDAPGLASLVIGLSLFVFALMQGPDWGWGNGIIILALLLGAAALVVFVVIEARRPAPLIQVRLFAIPSFSAFSLVLFMGQFCKIVIVVFGALYLQERLQMTPLTAGLALLVCVAGFPLFSTSAGKLADRKGARLPVLVSFAVAVAAMAWIGLATAGDSYLWLLPGLILWGLGMPFCYAPTIRAMANQVPKDQQGQVSGVGVTARLLGGTIGMALCSSLLSMTGSYQAVFLLTAALMLFTLLVAYLTIGKDDPEKDANETDNEQPS